MSQLIQDR